MSSWRIALLLRVAALITLASSGCASSGVGFGVAVTLDADESVTDDALKQIEALSVTASGDEQGTFAEMIGHTFTRHESFVYRPKPSTQLLILAISAVDGEGNEIASGKSNTLTLKPGETTFAGVLLSAGIGSDFGVEDLTTPRLLPDAFVADLAKSVDAGELPPSAPTALTLAQQTASSISLAWIAATPGSAAIDHYQIYRNGTRYATSTKAAYVDNAATNATSPTYAMPATRYSYEVSAVDTAGREGSKTTLTTLHIYNNGVYYWGMDYSFEDSVDYTDTIGMPAEGTMDISVMVTTAFAGWQPVAGGSTPTWDCEVSAFDHFSIALKPTQENQEWSLDVYSQMADGNSYFSSKTMLDAYGPTPVVGTWATYAIPLTVLGIGAGTFVASISGTTMTVTSATKGLPMTPGAFVTGAGVMPGTFISTAPTSGGVGTYTVSSSQTVASATLTYSHTNVYYFGLQDASGRSSNLYYIDDAKLIGSSGP